MSRVHEERNDDRIALRLGRANQREMALMQRSHGGYETNASAAHVVSLARFADFGNRGKDLHRLSIVITELRKAEPAALSEFPSAARGFPAIASWFAQLRQAALPD